MSVAILGSLIIWLIVAVIVIAIVVYFVNWLYRRSSKEVSFVRTGLFGEKVVINSGAFVLPFIHDVTPVNMNVLRMQVVRNRDDALITKDRMPWWPMPQNSWQGITCSPGFLKRIGNSAT